MRTSYNWLQSYFKDPLPEPKELISLLTRKAFEIDGWDQIKTTHGSDVSIDVDILPNRAHDALSHRGIAREVSALLEKQIILPEYSKKLSLPLQKSTLTVSIDNEALSRRYCSRIIHNISIAASPSWLRERLEVVDARRINAVVDATNYIMLDMGQPLHAFDINKVGGKNIHIRESRNGESIALLGDTTKKLERGMTVVANEVAPIALAGIKGGKNPEVTTDTVSILLESAHFDPSRTRKTARSVGIHNDSTKRFENEFNPDLCRPALEELTALIVDLCGTSETVVEEIVDVYPRPMNRESISLTDSDISSMLGVVVSDQEVSSILTRLGFKVLYSNNSYTVTPPSLRLDISLPEDVIEEVGRFHGFDTIPAQMPSVVDKPLVSKEYYYVSRLRAFLVSCGFSEIYTSSFSSEGLIKVPHPLAKDKEFVRSKLSDHMHEALDLNSKNSELLGVEGVRLFEVGTVFTEGQEYTALILGIGGIKKTSQEIERMRLNLTEEFGVTFEGHSDSDFVWEINLSHIIEELPVITSKETVYPFTQSEQSAVFSPISLYPVVLRDIAVWIPKEIDQRELKSLIKEKAGELLAQNPRLLDIYEKDERISYAYRLVFQSNEKTLSDKEVNEIMDILTKVLTEKGWEVR